MLQRNIVLLDQAADAARTNHGDCNEQHCDDDIETDDAQVVKKLRCRQIALPPPSALLCLAGRSSRRRCWHQKAERLLFSTITPLMRANCHLVFGALMAFAVIHPGLLFALIDASERILSFHKQEVIDEGSVVVVVFLLFFN